MPEHMTPIVCGCLEGKVKIRNNPYFEGKVGIVEQFYYSLENIYMAKKKQDANPFLTLRSREGSLK